MAIAGGLCRRLGSQRVTVISCALLSVTLVLPALAGSAITLGLALLFFGAAYGCLNVAMNSIAVDLVAALRRPVMPGFHAAWSFGGLAGAVLGTPLGILLYGAVKHGSTMTYPPAWWLACVVIATPLVVGALTVIPARAAARADMARVLQSGAA